MEETVSYLLQQCINGLQLGAVYALIALGYTMVYGVLRLINFAHGDVFMLGAFIAYYLISKFNIPIYLVFAITMVCTAGAGFIIEKVAYKPLRNAPRISLLITAVGVSLFLEYFLSLKFLFTANYIGFPRPFEVEVYDLSLFTVTNIQLIIFAVTAVSLLLLFLLIYRTRYGKAMRAVSYDQEVASLMGINIDATISLTFIVGAALAGVGGILYSIAYPQINVFMGVMPGIKSFIAAVLGGIGIIHGAVLGGFVIGISEVFVSGFLSSTFRDGVIFIILFLVLLLKPSGIFGKRIEKV
ncbi:branched-chain amino acid ABC transporter permease [Syntrophorhabdus aromaticivorans]|uniref:branched-chain amino acid ABC transporter permease n=1 Tax=Syntrophorhabdus aromaticivorans TaxID=328301 RepID=UPI00040BE848|nr:branched-chain amino acid ABC transporter permease [Syntrophorhabdus aromaticivorans]HBA56034.1 branched-chain amino acid ABC transporter permease [Syntrophorhabdus aromaticivorans]